MSVDTLTLGTTSDGTPATVALADLGAVIACGLPAADCAAMVRSLFAQLCIDPDVQLVVIGPDDLTAELAPRIAARLSPEDAVVSGRLVGQVAEVLHQRPDAAITHRIGPDTPRLALLVADPTDRLLPRRDLANLAATLGRLGARAGVLSLWATTEPEAPPVLADTAAVRLDHGSGDGPTEAALTRPGADPVMITRHTVTAEAAEGLARGTAPFRRRVPRITLGAT